MQLSWAGSWRGVLTAGGKQLRLSLVITQSADGRLAGHMASLDQPPGQSIALTTLSVVDGRLRFALSARGISYEGTWDPAASHFSGVFRQRGDFPLTFVRGAFAAAPVVAGLDGLWEGVTHRNGASMPMILHVTTGASGTMASFDAPNMLAKGLLVTGLERKGQQIRFTLPTVGVSFAGSLDGKYLSGQWTDGGHSRFQRNGADDKPMASYRPQTPRPPFPYEEIEARIDNVSAPGVTLAATLAVPLGKGPFPAVVLITGSGPQDRDETAFGHKPFSVLSDHLSRRGIAVVRYDDRGVGQSTGSHAGATSADFATDAAAVLAWLSSHPKIDPATVGFVGHSEGGMIAPLAARDNPKATFLVLLAAPGVRISEMLETQRRSLAETQGLSAAELALSERLQTELIRIAAAGSDNASARAAIEGALRDATNAGVRLPPAAHETIRRQILDPWFRWFVRYDPAPALSRFPGPILALNGTLDRQVRAKQNLEGIRAAAAGNNAARIVELPGLNHLFQTARTGALGEYASIEETMSPTAMNLISGWIANLHGKDETILQR